MSETVKETAVSSDTLDWFARGEKLIFGTVDNIAHSLTTFFSRPATVAEEGGMVVEEDPDTLPATPGQKRIFYWIGALALLIDQGSKWAIEATMPLNTSIAPIPELDYFFRLTHVANTGAAFGLFPQASSLFTIMAMILSFFIAHFNYQLPTRSRTMRITLGVIFGGALGNLVDRFRIGHVTDFLDFDLRFLIDWPFLDWAIFNVADACVVFGTMFLAYQMFRLQEAQHQMEQQQKMEEMITAVLPNVLARMEADGRLGTSLSPVTEDTLPPFLAARQNNYHE